ncbi:MAG: flagellar hook capping protein [Sphingobium sp.]|nr:flagellar hook capping protein [Sphingobium sp.]MBP6112390.1 flagellar hook capping protein [Sphingobium sp.]MBP8671421.1 flagellar hook capping protein [Sphingobium sp.]MBP9156250.1 flagellar hook capping protein [Sphingobium sp.]MCC6482426.1 flagellar hook capping protein [Sphingomonadaceae bacterium]
MTVTATNNNGTTTYVGSADNLTQNSNGVTQKSLAQTDFLTLLTAQLKSQDPFNPMDNADLVAQMATISNTSGIAEMNKSLQSISDAVSGSRINDAASWIGRSMLVKSNVAAPDAQGNYAGQLTLDANATALSVDLIDGNGNTVKTIDLGARPAGDTSFYWNGKDDAGNYVAGQPLQVKVRGATPTEVDTWASIAAVQSPADGSQAKLITPLGSFSPSQAIKLT